VGYTRTCLSVAGVLVSVYVWDLWGCCEDCVRAWTKIFIGTHL